MKLWIFRLQMPRLDVQVSSMILTSLQRCFSSIWNWIKIVACILIISSFANQVLTSSLVYQLIDCQLTNCYCRHAWMGLKVWLSAFSSKWSDFLIADNNSVKTAEAFAAILLWAEMFQVRRSERCLFSMFDHDSDKHVVNSDGGVCLHIGNHGPGSQSFTVYDRHPYFWWVEGDSLPCLSVSSHFTHIFCVFLLGSVCVSLLLLTVSTLPFASYFFGLWCQGHIVLSLLNSFFFLCYLQGFGSALSIIGDPPFDEGWDTTAVILLQEVNLKPKPFLPRLRHWNRWWE